MDVPEEDAVRLLSLEAAWKVLPAACVLSEVDMDCELEAACAVQRAPRMHRAGSCEKELS